MNGHAQRQFNQLQSWLTASPASCDTMQLKWSKNKGRYLVSKRALKEGELVAVSAPYFLLPNEARKHFVCDNCSGYVQGDINKELPFHCDTCNCVYYCSQQCQQLAWNKWHAYECRCFQMLCERDSKSPLHQSEKKKQHLFCLAKFLIRIFLLQTIEKLPTSPPLSPTQSDNSNNDRNSNISSSNNGSNDSDNDSNGHADSYHSNYHYSFSDIECLCDNVDIMPEKKLKIMQKVSKLVHQTLQQFVQEQRGLIKQQQRQQQQEDQQQQPQQQQQQQQQQQEMLRALLQSFVEPSYNEIVQMACREESNAFGVYYPLKDMVQNNELDDSSETRLFAFGFYPIPSLCNHSCGPNLYKILKGKSYYLYALHDIPAGTELCHAYIDLDKNTNQRRTELLNHYGFYCSCRRCEDDDIEDRFMRRYICSKFECGGLFIKHVQNLPEYDEEDGSNSSNNSNNCSNSNNKEVENTDKDSSSSCGTNGTETATDSKKSKKKKKKGKGSSSSGSSSNNSSNHKTLNLKKLKLRDSQRICHKCRHVDDVDDDDDY